MKVYTHEDVLKLMNRIHVYEINRDLCMLKLIPIDMEEKLLKYWNGGIKSTEEGGKSFDQYHNELHEDNLEEIISKAHTKIIRTKGKEYAPTSNEIQKEIDATSTQTERIYSEKEFLAFSEWISSEDWVYLPSKGYWVNEEQEELEQKFTTNQLFEKFKN